MSWLDNEDLQPLPTQAEPVDQALFTAEQVAAAVAAAVAAQASGDDPKQAALDAIATDSETPA